ncbi:MAG: hypothetical protein LQ346_005971 [Caloplaca aetnensis]|nr:MAG: hypothetical protein LQ346_005971 [Caloplaca aetnensis]
MLPKADLLEGPISSSMAATVIGAAQHFVHYSKASQEPNSEELKDAFKWVSSPRSPPSGKEGDPEVIEVEDRLLPIHPIYVIPWPAFKDAASWYEGKAGF